jgi:hypothetical protein
MIIKINNYEIKPSDKNNLHFFDLYDTSSKSKVIEYVVPLQHLLIKLAHYEVNSKDQEYTLEQYVTELTNCIKKYLKND